MKVTLDEIKQIFDDLIKEKKPFEEVSNWALERLFADDVEPLQCEPPTERLKILRAILYLTGVDLRDLDGGYLHSIENFIDFKNELNL